MGTVVPPRCWEKLGPTGRAIEADRARELRTVFNHTIEDEQQHRVMPASAGRLIRSATADRSSEQVQDEFEHPERLAIRRFQDHI